MKISASIYSNNGIAPEELVKQLDTHQIDFIHIDSRDNADVFADIARIRQHSQTPIDLHLISADPEQYFEAAAATKVELLTLQYESLRDAVTQSDAPKAGQVAKQIPQIDSSKYGGWQPKMGLAITSDTPIDVFEACADQFDFILFMTTVPGESGGQFNRSNFKKIRAFKRRFPSKRIHVDGGVNAEVSFILRNMGVYSAVSGSYLLRGQTIGAKLLQLKHNETESAYKVADFMMGREEIPILQDGPGLSLPTLLQTIEDYRMGFAILENEQQELTGISSSADVRKGLLKNVADLNKTSVQDVINRTPVRANNDQTVAELLEMIKTSNFPIGYLPVVDKSGKLTGALKFNNLIKGEL